MLTKLNLTENNANIALDYVGKCGIRASIILDSIYMPTRSRITTFEIEYPRFILSEFNTHRMLSRNTASSRAIPVDKMHQHIRDNTAIPVVWGQNKAGMQADHEILPDIQNYAKLTWLEARDSALRYSRLLADFDVHKQITNRLTEPFQLVKTVVTATEWANFWALRDHEMAQPEFHELAHIMHTLYTKSQPKALKTDEWHLPYVKTGTAANHQQLFIDEQTGLEIKLEDAIKISASCCAQVSYRKQDTSLEKAIRIYDQLIESKPAHASPVEHQATPITTWDTIERIGISHQDRIGNLWSGNFRGWIQYRKLIPGECKW